MLSVAVQRRAFTIPGFSGKPIPPVEKQPASIQSLNLTQADLNVGEDMPPVLQYNEELVLVALELVEIANGTARSRPAGLPELTVAEQEVVAGVVAMLFCDRFVAPVDQYVATRALHKHSSLRSHPDIQRCMHTVLSTFLPRPLADLLKFCDGGLVSQLVSAGSAPVSAEQEALMERLVTVVLEGREDDDSLLMCLQDMEASFPALFGATPFIALLQRLNDVSLQARFACLINETCLAFDPDGTGRVKLEELRDALEQVIPKEAAAKMMGGVDANDDGTVFYPQMAQIFMHGVTSDHGAGGTSGGGGSKS